MLDRFRLAVLADKGLDLFIENRYPGRAGVFPSQLIAFISLLGGGHRKFRTQFGYATRRDEATGCLAENVPEDSFAFVNVGLILGKLSGYFFLAELAEAGPVGFGKVDVCLSFAINLVGAELELNHDQQVVGTERGPHCPSGAEGQRGGWEGDVW